MNGYNASLRRRWCRFDSCRGQKKQKVFNFPFFYKIKRVNFWFTHPPLVLQCCWPFGNHEPLSGIGPTLTTLPCLLSCRSFHQCEIVCKKKQAAATGRRTGMSARLTAPPKVFRKSRTCCFNLIFVPTSRG